LSFTSLPARRFHHSTAYEYYLPESQFNKFSLVDYIHAKCVGSDSFDCKRVEGLRGADLIDLDFDTISHALTITAFWHSQTWDLDILNKEPKNRVEVGILSNEKPVEVEELNLGGFLTVVGEDTKPSPTLFAFPSRHHPLSSSFSATFLKPIGLHPSLQLRISDSKPPSKERTCSLHAYFTLPRVIFADKYQLSDPLFMASKNLSTVHYITKPVDLEAPEYTMLLWGSSLLVELSPPAPSSNSWTAELPLHLRYLLPTPSGYSDVLIPWPVLFWACTADEGSKFTINPFDRVNLGYDGLFGPRTTFHHLSPVLPEVKDMGLKGEGYDVISVPVLNENYSKWVELGTAAAILLGFGWVMWKLLVVLRNEGYGRGSSAKVDKIQ
jgi:PIG-X / PBN1